VDDREAFLAVIAADPVNHVERCVYADWLDEHGEVEEATRQRAWVGAYEFLQNQFVNPYWIEEGAGPPDRIHALEMIESWRQSLVEDGGICFDTDDAASNIWDDNNRDEFYRCLEIVTGKTILPETRVAARFSCAC
jgi:uncharacterized protein (TIGR02996 family)